ncbi:hypothetical protein F4001_05285 [Candidatus Poribacteria bacterium]|nr:hypothetical protein [Candidatus Poribacteria bacterium]
MTASYRVTRSVWGSAVSLAQAGASVVDMQVAGRWKSSQMPAHYAKAELAERGQLRDIKMGKMDNLIIQSVNFIDSPVASQVAVTFGGFFITLCNKPCFQNTT